MSTVPENSPLILKEFLFDRCDKRESGTVFITTKHNKSCQVSITRGQITAFSLGSRKGVDAVKELSSSGCLKASFDSRLKNMPLGENAKIESSDAALLCLGYIAKVVVAPPKGVIDEAFSNFEDFSSFDDSKASVMSVLIKELNQKRDLKELLTKEIHIGRK